MLKDRRNLAVKIFIEQFKQGQRWHTVGQQGEAAHIREPNCCIDRFGMASPNCAGENALSGLVAHIGVEQIGCGPLKSTDFSNPRQGSDDRLDSLNLRVRGLLSSYAFAQGLEQKQWSRVAASGAKQRIGFFHALHPDCTAPGDVTLRVTKQPEHGAVDTIAMTNYPAYPKENIRSECNEHKVKGMQINYKSAEKYVGSDALEVCQHNGAEYPIRVP